MSSNEAWPKLERTYASKSRTRMLGLRETLANTWKESNSVSKYMQTIKWIADDLAFIGHPLNEDELIVYVFNGLEPDFKEINATVRARDSPISFEELHDKLLDHETFLKRGESKKVNTPITAQFT